MLQHRVLAFQRLETERSSGPQRSDKGHAEIRKPIIDERRAVSGEVAMLSTRRAPDERAVARIEFLNASRIGSPLAKGVRASEPEISLKAAGRSDLRMNCEFAAVAGQACHSRS